MEPCILLVDDDPGIQSGLHSYLSRRGYRMLSASSLTEARQSLSEAQVDAVLLDLALPDGNGIDWIAQLHTDHPDLAIVVVTGTGDVRNAVEAMRHGADNFLIKPVDLPGPVVFLQKSLEVQELRRRQAAPDAPMQQP